MLPNQFIEEVEKLKDEYPNHEVIVRIKGANGDWIKKVANVIVGTEGLEIICEPL